MFPQTLDFYVPKYPLPCFTCHPGHYLVLMYRISRDGQKLVVVKTIKAITAAICSRKPGRYDIDEICDESRVSGLIAMPWGVGIKWADGSIELQRDPQEE